MPKQSKPKKVNPVMEFVKQEIIRTGRLAKARVN